MKPNASSFETISRMGGGSMQNGKAGLGAGTGVLVIAQYRE
jgi:hypothetical protein